MKSKPFVTEYDMPPLPKLVQHMSLSSICDEWDKKKNWYMVKADRTWAAKYGGWGFCDKRNGGEIHYWISERLPKIDRIRLFAHELGHYLFDGELKVPDDREHRAEWMAWLATIAEQLADECL